MFLIVGMQNTTLRACNNRNNFVKGLIPISKTIPIKRIVVNSTQYHIVHWRYWDVNKGVPK